MRSAIVRIDESRVEVELIDLVKFRPEALGWHFRYPQVFKLLYLALKNIEKKWTMPIREWKRALQQFAIVFEGRMPLP